MQITLSYEKEFTALWNYLKTKYPKELFDLDGVGKQLDMAWFSKNFFSQKGATTADVSVDENANVSDMSVVSYDAELTKPFERLNSYYMLWKYSRKYYGTEFADKIVEAQLAGDFYINDFHHFFTRPYCFNYSTYDIAISGLPYIDRIKCIPPKHLLTFKQQMEQFTVFASNNQSGAAGQADLLVIMSYYVRKALKNLQDAHFRFKSEEDVWYYVREIISSYIYTINQPFRANQSPFVNVSLYDDEFLTKLCEEIVFPDGSHPDKEIIKKMQVMFLDIMNEELERTPITYPVTTACFSIDENNNIKDKEFLRLIAERNLKWGFINIYCGDNSTLSSCCRLRSNTKNEYFNSYGAGSTKIGSLGVVTLNLPRAAIKAKGDREKFLKIIEELTEMACKINNVKRHIIKQRIQNGNLPLYTYGYMDLQKQYSTTGVTGLNEALYFMGEDVLTESGQKLQMDIINIINQTNVRMEKQYKVPTNCEQVPAENSAVKLAHKDKLLGYQGEFEIYSNQFIPLTTNADMLDRIKLQGMFDKEFSGGAICHINVENRITNAEDLMKLIEECAKKGVVYFAINYLLTCCENRHMTVGNRNSCSICGAPITDYFTRVVGFLTNVKNWNRVRREIDFPNRQWYGGI